MRKQRKKDPLLGMTALCTWQRIPIRAGVPCSKPTATFQDLPPPIALLPTNAVLLDLKMTLTCPILLIPGTLMLAKYHRQLYYPVVVEIDRSIQVHIPVNQTYQELLQVDRGSTTASHTDGRQFAVVDRWTSGQKPPPIIQVVRGSSCQISLNIIQKTQYEKQTELLAVRYRCPSYW